MGTLALIALGSNLGDRRAHLDAAVAALAAAPGITLQRISTYYETAAVGGPSNQGAFLNAAAALDSTLDPVDLLQTLHRIEREAGRVRLIRWGERPLDLDLILFGDRVIETEPTQNRVYGGVTPGLTVPHPRMPFRRFVLIPLAEIAPDAVDPLTGRTIAELLANLDRRPHYCALHHPFGQFRPDFVALLCKTASGTIIEQRSRRNPVHDFPIELQQHMHQRMPHRKQLRRQFLALSLAAHAADPVDEGWMFSRFWFDANFLTSLTATNEANFATIREKFLAKRSEIIEPTFVVAPPGSRRRFARGSSEWIPSPNLGSTPILEVPTDDPDQALEDVAAACKALRPS